MIDPEDDVRSEERLWEEENLDDKTDSLNFIGKIIPVFKNADLFTGLWSFKGYYPDGCFPHPKCLINKLSFNFTERDWNKRALGFTTSWNMEGEDCEEESLEFKERGWTWVKKGKIFINSEFNNGKLFAEFDEYASNYKVYKGRDQKNELFVDTMDVKNCYCQYEKIPNGDYKTGEVTSDPQR